MMSNKLMYRISMLCDIEIKEYEITKETDKTVWFNRINHRNEIVTDRELKSTSYYIWFDTLESARSYVTSKLESKVKSAKSNLKYAEENLNKFNLSIR